LQFDPSGFQWVETNCREKCILAYLRKSGRRQILVALNLTPEPHKDFVFHLPESSRWAEALNTDDQKYWGTGYFLNPGQLKTESHPEQPGDHRLVLNLPPLGAVLLRKS